MPHDILQRIENPRRFQFFFTFVNTKWILVSHEIIILAIKGKASLIYKWRFDIKVWLVWLAFVGVRKKTKIFLKFWSELSQVARMCEFSSSFVRKAGKEHERFSEFRRVLWSKVEFLCVIMARSSRASPMSPEVSISSRKSRNIGRDLDGSCNEVKKKRLAVNCVKLRQRKNRA